MRGTCDQCRYHQANGLADYCCVLCALNAGPYANAPKSMTPEGTIVIDLRAYFPPQTSRELPR